MDQLHKDARIIVERAIEANMPEDAVSAALDGHDFGGDGKNIALLAIGKAAWRMARAAREKLGERIKNGIVITKYGHSMGEIPGVEIIEAGHPLPDENSVRGTEKAVAMAENLGPEDELLFLISGGGSALFEMPLPGVTLDELIEINDRLLACGANIIEINTIRKRLSAVKAGRFAKLCRDTKIFAVALSDVLGNRLDSIASGPAAPDESTSEEAMEIVRKYDLALTDKMKMNISTETPKKIDNVRTVITGSVDTLCDFAADVAGILYYTPHILCTDMNCEAREAGRLAAAIARRVNGGDDSFKSPCAIIMGGETVVNLKGKGKGGRNQEFVLAAAQGIAGMENTVIISVGSDGTDGPTDAAGGFVDGATAAELRAKGINIDETLRNNDSYNALKAADRLIITGPTGTNVNDVAVILCGGAKKTSPTRELLRTADKEASPA